MGNAFPRPPGAKKKIAQVSVTKWELDAGNFFVLKVETEVGPRCGSFLIGIPISCMCMCLHFANSLWSRRGVRRVEKSKVAFKRSFRFGGETSIVQGNFAFSGCQMSKIFSGSASGRRGHAPHGRRGQVFCSTNVIQTLLRI